MHVLGALEEFTNGALLILIGHIFLPALWIQEQVIGLIVNFVLGSVPRSFELDVV